MMQWQEKINAFGMSFDGIGTMEFIVKVLLIMFFIESIFGWTKDEA